MLPLHGAYRSPGSNAGEIACLRGPVKTVAPTKQWRVQDTVRGAVKRPLAKDPAAPTSPQPPQRGEGHVRSCSPQSVSCTRSGGCRGAELGLRCEKKPFGEGSSSPHIPRWLSECACFGFGSCVGKRKSPHGCFRAGVTFQDHQIKSASSRRRRRPPPWRDRHRGTVRISGSGPWAIPRARPSTWAARSAALRT